MKFKIYGEIFYKNGDCEEIKEEIKTKEIIIKIKRKKKKNIKKKNE